MSEDMGHDETILGTALARAVASQPIRATPFERSRIALRMAGGGRSALAPLLAAAAAILLGLTLGATLLGQRGPDTGGPATQPSPTATPGATSTAAASPTATAGPVEKLRVYFARDQLPPVGVEIDVALNEGPTREGRVQARLRTLATATAPSGLTNVIASSRTKPTVGEVRFEGDLVRVDYTVPNGDWGLSGSAATIAALQQLVYSASEEPGIRRVLITENGGKPTTIDQLEIAEPLAREAVLPYEGVKTEESIALDDDPRPATLAAIFGEDPAIALTLLVIEMRVTEVPEGGFWSPRMSAEMRPNDDERAIPGKWLLEISLPGASDPRSPAQQTPESSLVRSLRTTSDASGTTYLLGLEDARPWRVALEPGAGHMRLIVELGGHPQAVSDSISVTDPRPGSDRGRTFQVRGSARAFEAHVSWRLKDSREREVASGFANASLGTSPVWGTFDTEVKVPDGVSGVVTLEVFWPSPRDGSDVGMVAIPLRVR